MTVDLSPIVQPAIDTAGLILVACAPVLAGLALRLLHLQGNAAAVAAVNAVAQTGAGLAYAELAAAGQRPASVEIKSAALAAGVQHVLDAAPAAVRRSGLTEQLVAQQVAGELGRLLARDPTVSAGPSASVPPPAPTV